MDIAHFISNYGYIAVMIGAPIEGDLVLILAGLAVHAGYLKSIITLVIMAFIGTAVSDIFFFALGRWKGKKIVNHFHYVRRLVAGPTKLIHKNAILVAFASRFLYGFRIIVPFTLGFSSMSFKKFLVLNTITTFIWIGFFTWLGYFFGTGLTLFIHRLKQYEFKIILLVALLFVLGHLLFSIMRFFVVEFSTTDEE